MLQLHKSQGAMSLVQHLGLNHHFAIMPWYVLCLSKAHFQLGAALNNRRFKDWQELFT